MAIICMATFGLFCLTAQMQKVEVDVSRERGAGRFYNEVKLKAATWRASYLFTDRPGISPPELATAFSSTDAKSVCQGTACIRYHAFCVVAPPGVKPDVGRISCPIEFEVGEYLPGQRFGETITIYADEEKRVEDAMKSLAFMRPVDSKIVSRPDGSENRLDQPRSSPQMIVPFTALSVAIRKLH